MISNSKRFIFIHIPKNAGTSMDIALSQLKIKAKLGVHNKGGNKKHYSRFYDSDTRDIVLRHYKKGHRDI